MKRREALSLAAISIGTIPLLGFKVFQNRFIDKPEWLLDWIKINDNNLINYKVLKVSDVSNKYFGGYMNEAEIPNPQSTSGFIIRASTLFTCAESIYFQSTDILKNLEEAAQSMLNFQNSDGTIDLLETNFHSTPDTAFVLENIVPAYQFLVKSKIESADKLINLLKSFLIKAGEALVVGGIHTPNHRWVVCAALTRLNEILPDKRYANRIEQWLAEHIDIDEDGQFTEKSTNSYSPIVNRSLIIMARGLNKPELLEPVRRNLMMTLFYVHPNGEVVTEASNRQDKGTIGNMAKYYYCYRYMALNDKNGEMAAMCHQIEQTSTPAQLAGYLDYFLEDPTLWNNLATEKPLPTHYTKAFPFSGVVRIRKGNWDSTILSNNASFLTFHKRNAILQGMRIAASFFGKGQFQSEKIENIEGKWVLKNSLEGPYYQPIHKKYIDKNGDWEKMPKDKRPQSEIQKLESTVKISEKEEGVEIEIEITGTEHVPISIELILRGGGSFSGVDKYVKRENAYLFSGRNCSYTVAHDQLNIGNGIISHKQLQLRGALPAMDAPTIYLAGFSPFHHTITIS